MQDSPSEISWLLDKQEFLVWLQLITIHQGLLDHHWFSETATLIDLCRFSKWSRSPQNCTGLHLYSIKDEIVQAWLLEHLYPCPWHRIHAHLHWGRPLRGTPLDLYLDLDTSWSILHKGNLDYWVLLTYIHDILTLLNYWLFLMSCRLVPLEQPIQAIAWFWSYSQCSA